jgi:hypothetical protein
MNATAGHLNAAGPPGQRSGSASLPRPATRRLRGAERSISALNTRQVARTRPDPPALERMARANGDGGAGVPARRPVFSDRILKRRPRSAGNMPLADLGWARRKGP